MKNTNRRSAIIALTIMLMACGDAVISGDPAAAQPDSTHAVAPAGEAAYACPMHPEVTGKEGDTCSKCGMDLEVVK